MRVDRPELISSVRVLMDVGGSQPEPPGNFTRGQGEFVCRVTSQKWDC